MSSSLLDVDVHLIVFDKLLYMMHHWAKGAFYLALHSSLFGPDGQFIMIILSTDSIKSLLIGSKCIPSDTNTNHC